MEEFLCINICEKASKSNFLKFMHSIFYQYLESNKLLFLKNSLKLEIFSYLPLRCRIYVISNLNKSSSIALNSCKVIRSLKKNFGNYIFEIINNRESFCKMLLDFEMFRHLNLSSFFDILKYIFEKIYENKEIVIECSNPENNLIEKISNIYNYFDIIIIKEIKFLDFPQIKILNLGKNYFSDKGLFFLSNINLPNLDVLKLNNNDISYRGMLHFSKMKLNILSELDLNHNKICDLGVEYFYKMKFLFLEILNLSHNMITDKGFNLLLNMDLKLLKFLIMNSNKNSEKIYDFVKKYQNVQIFL